MSAPEMINELKRLSNVVTSLEGVIVELQTSNTNLVNMISEQVTSNVNLTDMIAQQLITNVNLANSINELQNQVAQQTITNTNMTNMIAELQISVVRLTTITGQLVTVNTRALDDTDLAHEPLPYDTEVYIKSAAAVGAGLRAYTWQDAIDWPIGQRLYPIAVAIDIFCALEPMPAKDDGMTIYIYNNVGGLGVGERLSGETWTYPNYPFYWDGASFWRFYHYIKMPKNEMQSDDFFVVEIGNYTGVVMTSVNCWLLAYTL